MTAVEDDVGRGNGWQWQSVEYVEYVVLVVVLGWLAGDLDKVTGQLIENENGE